MINFNDFIISEKASAMEALELINNVGIPNMTIFITDSDKKLKGSLTDGDIRRGLLNGLVIGFPVTNFMNVSSKFFSDNENNFSKARKYKALGIRFVQPYV